MRRPALALVALGRQVIDWEAHRQRMVKHWVGLYLAPGFGPRYANQAGRDYLARSGCPFPDIGRDYQARIAGVDPQGALARAEARLPVLKPSPESWS